MSTAVMTQLEGCTHLPNSKKVLLPHFLILIRVFQVWFPYPYVPPKWFPYWFETETQEPGRDVTTDVRCVAAGRRPRDESDNKMLISHLIFPLPFRPFWSIYVFFVPIHFLSYFSCHFITWGFYRVPRKKMADLFSLVSLAPPPAYFVASSYYKLSQKSFHSPWTCLD